MAKSLRAKAKMANRRKKREGGNYHAADVARSARISAKLLGKDKKKVQEEEDEEMVEDEEEVVKDGEDANMDGKDEPAKISTSGPRSSRREEWRKSKGMDARPKRLGQNSIGVAGARHKSGKPKRRR